MRQNSGQAAIIFILIIAIIFLFIAITVNVSKVAELKNTVSFVAEGAATDLAAKLGSYSGLLKEKGESAEGWDLGYVVKEIIGVGLTIGGIATGNPALIKTGVIMIGTGAVNQVLVGLDVGLVNRKLAEAGMDLKGQLREQAIQYALTRVVDDPKMVQDLYDIDEDGDTEEQVSRFAVKYLARTNNIVAELKSNGFELFLSYLNGFQPPLQGFGDEMVDFSGFLEGEFVLLLQELKDQGFIVSFWEEGVDWDKMGDENPAPENDDIDRLRYIIDYSGNEDTFEAFVATTIEDLEGGALITGVVFTPWNKRLYDPENESNDDWYSLFGRYSTIMDAWLAELRDKKSGLEGTLLSKQELMESIQKRIEEIEGEGGEIDKLNEQIAGLDPVDDAEEIARLRKEITVLEEERSQRLIQLADVQTQIDGLDGLIGRVRYCITRIESAQSTALGNGIQEFRAAVDGFEAVIETAFADAGEAIKAIAVKYNPVTYSWHDSRGNHFVRVCVDGFYMPELDINTHWYGKTDYTLDHPTGSCGVEVTRFDEGQDTYLWNFRYTKDAEAEISDPLEEAGFDLPGAEEKVVEHGISAKRTRDYKIGGCVSE